MTTTEHQGPRTADTWADYYSQRNALVLEASGASSVAGYREWIELGRHVRRGEHGIALTAPVVVKDRDTGESRMVNTRTTYVFDISQTDEL